METTHLNLVTGERDKLPEAVEFDSARKRGSAWVIKLLAAWEEYVSMYQLFEHIFYDVDRNEYEINGDA